MSRYPSSCGTCGLLCWCWSGSREATNGPPERWSVGLAESGARWMVGDEAVSASGALAGRASEKIQSICNGKLMPITMQGLARAKEKPRRQEQWQAMEKTMRGAMETIGNPGACLRPVAARQDWQGRCHHNNRQPRVKEITSFAATLQDGLSPRVLPSASPRTGSAKPIG